MNYSLLMLSLEAHEKRSTLDYLRKRKERGAGKMPVELLREFIGQVCQINMFDGMGEVAMLVAVEENWLKIEENGNNKLINGELVRSISAMPQKYQEKYQEKYRRRQER